MGCLCQTLIRATFSPGGATKADDRPHVTGTISVEVEIFKSTISIDSTGLARLFFRCLSVSLSADFRKDDGQLSREFTEANDCYQHGGLSSGVTSPT